MNTNLSNHTEELVYQNIISSLSKRALAFPTVAINLLKQHKIKSATTQCRIFLVPEKVTRIKYQSKAATKAESIRIWSRSDWHSADVNRKSHCTLKICLQFPWHLHFWGSNEVEKIQIQLTYSTFFLSQKIILYFLLTVSICLYPTPPAHLSLNRIHK